MSYSKNIAQIVENSKLEILLFDAHWRTEMDYRNLMLDCYVVSFIKEGSCRLRIFDKDYYAAAGDVLLIPPNIKHDHVKDTAENTFFMWWHFDYRMSGIFDVLSMYQLPICFRLQDSTRFEKVFARFLECSNHPSRLSDFIMKEALSLELIAIILDAAVINDQTKLNAQYNDTFLQILLGIVTNPESNWNLKELGEKYHLHPTYLSNHFKRMYGISPIALKQELRFKKSKDLLRNENIPISSIAELLGYPDIDDFTRFFKRMEGISPLRYKQALRQKYDFSSYPEEKGNRRERDSS